MCRFCHLLQSNRVLLECIWTCYYEFAILNSIISLYPNAIFGISVRIHTICGKWCQPNKFDLKCFDLAHFQGVYGYPIEIQALFFMALRCALLLLKQDEEGKDCADRISKRLHALSYHMRNYFWLDIKQLNDIYRYKTEEYSHTAVNKFNVMPDSLPDWVFDFMPTRGGYFIGNVSPARMDFRWFCLGNCVAILSSLATPEQASAIMDLIESRWDELVGEMPLKICYPAMESHEWRIVTGCDPKNTSWSYHNGGSWPGNLITFSFKFF